MIATDRAEWLEGAAPRRRAPMVRTSSYVTMRDGVRIAVDVHLPKERPARVPAIVRATRYYRGVNLRSPLGALGVEWLLDHAAKTRERFVAAGYAWVDVCARGSGASFGSRPCPWSPDEVADGRELCAWITAQPWSDGRIGATGVSYDGTAADFLLIAGHPAVRAIAPRFSLFDTFADVAFPGGIHLAGFTAQWAAFNRALDTGRFDDAFVRKIAQQIAAWRAGRSLPRLRGREGEGVLAAGWEQRVAQALAPVLRAVCPGVRAVDGEETQLARAIVDHAANADVHAAALGLTCRDDTGASAVYPDASIDLFSPHSYLDALRASDAPIHSMSGWMDGAYAHAAVKRFRSARRPGAELVLGPWEHGGMQHVSPYSPSRSVAFDQDGALVRFFDRHLKARGQAADPPVRWFTVGAEAWRSADDWPPPARPLRLHLAEGRRLAATAPTRPGADEYRVDATLGMGPRTRYDALLGLLPPVGYPRARDVDARMLVYRSDPLDTPLEITGHPVVRLSVAADERDAFVFAYLQEELPDGTVHWMTDGQLRAAHRALSERPAYDTPAPVHSFTRADMRPLDGTCELTFDLLPLSWRVARGHRIRLALAGADRDHFAAPPAAQTLRFHRPGSCLELPVALAP